MILVVMSSVFAFPYATLMPIFADTVLHVGKEGYGMLMAVSGVGSLVGALSLTWQSGRSTVKRGRTIIIGSMGLPLFLGVFALSQNYLLSLAMLAGVGWTMISVNARARERRICLPLYRNGPVWKPSVWIDRRPFRRTCRRGIWGGCMRAGRALHILQTTQGFPIAVARQRHWPGIACLVVVAIAAILCACSGLFAAPNCWARMAYVSTYRQLLSRAKSSIGTRLPVVIPTSLYSGSFGGAMALGVDLRTSRDVSPTLWRSKEGATRLLSHDAGFAHGWKSTYAGRES
jgi:hypothetical protein